MKTLEADVLVLSAGHGTRLRPLTEAVPKPLVEVAGESLLSRNLSLLAEQGCRRVFINLHYLGEKIVEAVGDGSQWGLEVVYSEEPTLLDTGGAIRKIAPQLSYPQLITINSDVLLGSKLDFHQLLEHHCRSASEPLSTMVLREDPNIEQYGEIGTDDQGRVVCFLGHGNPEAVRNRLMFIGVQVLSRKATSLMLESPEVFSVTRDFLKPAVEGGALVNSYLFNGIWFDVGTVQRLQEAEKFLLNEI